MNPFFQFFMFSLLYINTEIVLNENTKLLPNRSLNTTNFGFKLRNNTVPPYCRYNKYFDLKKEIK